MGGGVIDRAGFDDVLKTGCFGNEHVDAFAFILERRKNNSPYLYQSYLYVLPLYQMHRDGQSPMFVTHVTKEKGVQRKKWSLYYSLPNMVHKDTHHYVGNAFKGKPSK